MEKLFGALHQPSSMSELKELYGWTNTTKFKTKYITPLIDEELVEMSQPDKPTSPNQRYFLTEKGRSLLANESRTPEVEERLNYRISRLIDNLNEEEKRIALKLLQGGK